MMLCCHCLILDFVAYNRFSRSLAGSIIIIFCQYRSARRSALTIALQERQLDVILVNTSPSTRRDALLRRTRELPQHENHNLSSKQQTGHYTVMRVLPPRNRICTTHRKHVCHLSFFSFRFAQIYHLQTREEIPAATSATLVEEGPLRATIEFQYQISEYVADLCLCACSSNVVLCADCVCGCVFQKIPLLSLKDENEVEFSLPSTKNPSLWYSSRPPTSLLVYTPSWSDFLLAKKFAWETSGLFFKKSRLAVENLVGLCLSKPCTERTEFSLLRVNEQRQRKDCQQSSLIEL